MPILYDKTGSSAFGIVPITPSLDGPRNAYAVTIREGERLLLERLYTTIQNSPDGHWYVWRLARALMAASSLVDAKVTYNITGREEVKFNEAVKLEVNTGWLTVILQGDTLIHRHGLPSPRNEARCWVQWYLLDEQASADQPLPSYDKFDMQCQPEDAAAFGTELLRECRAAKSLRLKLGIPAPADDYIDD